MEVELVFKNCDDEFLFVRKETREVSLFDYLSNDDDDCEFFRDVLDSLLEFVDKGFYLVEVRDISLSNF